MKFYKHILYYINFLICQWLKLNYTIWRIFFHIGKVTPGLPFSTASKFLYLMCFIQGLTTWAMKCSLGYYDYWVNYFFKCYNLILLYEVNYTPENGLASSLCIQYFCCHQITSGATDSFTPELEFQVFKKYLSALVNICLWLRSLHRYLLHVSFCI